MIDLKPFQNAIQQGVASVGLSGEPVELYEPIRYILSLGGKRLRPVLTLLAADAYGDWKQAVNQALSIEVFHNFTLVHDDIMDEAPLRRGKETVHQKWSVNRGILSGDAMLIEAYKLLPINHENKANDLLKVFNRVALEVCEGQQFDVNFERADTVTEQEYLNMIRLKTSVLLGGALELGAIVAEAPVQDRETLANFGVQLGMAFQIQDDILDVYGDPEKFGKQVGGDILANKKTLLMQHALRKADAEQLESLNKWMSSSLNSEQKVSEVTALFTKLEAREYATQVMNSYYKEAIESLQKTSMPQIKKEGLLAFANWLFNRDY